MTRSNPPINPAADASSLKRVRPLQHRPVFRQARAFNSVRQARCHGPRIIGCVPTPVKTNPVQVFVFEVSAPTYFGLHLPLPEGTAGQGSAWPSPASRPVSTKRRCRRDASAPGRASGQRKSNGRGGETPKAWVIGSDQIAVNGDGSQMPLGKPGTAVRCKEQLQSCSGRTVAFLTAVALMRREDSALIEFIDLHAGHFSRSGCSHDRALRREGATLGLRGRIQKRRSRHQLVRIDREHGSQRADRIASDTVERGAARRRLRDCLRSSDRIPRRGFLSARRFSNLFASRA